MIYNKIYQYVINGPIYMINMYKYIILFNILNNNLDYIISTSCCIT